jgi:hypothetical protein
MHRDLGGVRREAAFVAKSSAEDLARAARMAAARARLVRR